MTETDVTGVVLAGGASRRFGRDKLRVDVLGEPLMSHAVRRLAEVCARVIVVAGRGEPPRLPAELLADVVQDTEDFGGPLRATARGLRFVGTEWSVVAGGDMPDLRPPVLRDLVRLASDRDASAAALADGTRFRPLPCVLRSGPALVAADDLLARGERSLRSLLEHLSAAVLDERTWRALDPERRTLLDVDEPADLDRLRG